MKLRNKKTGKIGDLMGTLTSCPHVGIGVDFHDGEPKAFYYNSLTELNEEWEDYTPKEPLIKDEKIRKAVRAWADAMGLDAVDYEEGEFGTVFYSTDNMDDCKYRIEFCQFLHYLKNGYDCIADLCGEEEE